MLIFIVVHHELFSLATTSEFVAILVSSLLTLLLMLTDCSCFVEILDVKIELNLIGALVNSYIKYSSIKCK